MEKLPVSWIWFAELKGISLFAKRQLLETFHDPEELYRSEAKDLPPEILGQKDLTEATQIYGQCREKNIRIVTYGDASYPQRLQNIEDPPMVL